MRPTVLNPLFAPVTALAGVGPKLGKLVGRFCGETVSDVLWHLPTGVVHRPRAQSTTDLVADQILTVPFTVSYHQVPRSKRLPYRITGLVFGQALDLVFFNYHQAYLKKKYPDGTDLWISGKLERDGLGFKMIHPDYITAKPEDIPEYEVIYPQTRGVSSRLIRRITDQTLPTLPELPEWLDAAFQAKHRLPFWKNSLEAAHHPQREADLMPTNPARLRLAYDEILANQLALLLIRRQAKKATGQVVQGTGALAARLRQALPFRLTAAQDRVLIEIQRDLESPERMSRLLQGDVGSGKTIVALMAMITAIEGGFQSALMAPTDILARQHFEKLNRLCAPLGIRVALLTARDKGAERKKILADLAEGRTNILIGTHALLTDTVTFAHLGLVVIDEQHKFGVNQRLALIRKEKGVNLLVMTATPIPRSLALTVYGDMDVSRLDEKPAGRQPIETRVMPITRIPDLVRRLKVRIDDRTKRTQAYWICPLVEETESGDLAAVQKRYTELQKTFGDRVGLVHGRMKGPEKDDVMDRFARGDLDILVATTVIEVGVDVKTASIMIIEQAERFGLAGLHQLRGRVGRGSEASLCLLLHGPHLTETAKQRLNIMRETDDGFILAEEDLKLRGAGEVLGVRQSGLITFRMADPSIQSDLLATATKDAQTVLSLDPDLLSPRGQALRLLLYLFRKDCELQTLKAG